MKASIPVLRDSRGIALFMVLAAIGILSILITEFTYLSQVSQKMAYDSVDQLKAHYLAKSALKLSLLRLKAYQNLKGVLGNTGKPGSAPSNPLAAAAGSLVPKKMLDQIWAFPLIYPLPTELPGLSSTDKEKIGKFMKESSLEGSFTALIESESSRFNLNSIAAGFAPAPSASPSPSPTSTTSPSSNPQAQPSPSPSASIDPEAARKNVTEFLKSILDRKFEADPEFRDQYQSLVIEDLVSNLATWADPSYVPPIQPDSEVGFKKAPFYSISELNMVPMMDDELYNLFSQSLTVSPTAGMNINTLTKATLKALIPQLTEEELNEFFTFRDSSEKDNLFKDPQDFFTYLQNNTQTFRGDQTGVQELKSSLEKKGIKFIVDESQFKITIRAQVNGAVKNLEAWVTLADKGASSTPAPGASPSPSPSAAPQPGSLPVVGALTEPPKPDPGLKITFMRIF